MRSANPDPECTAAELQLDAVVVPDGDYLREIGPTGLVFASRSVLLPGAPIRLQIPVAPPVLDTTGRVVWCRPEHDHFIVGIEFLRKIDRFRARMIWQIFCIERYRVMVREREGRELTREEAAVEWIRWYASDFPKLDEFPER